MFIQMDDSDVINFLLSTELIPLCLRIMETGSELSKTVATFIVQKILLDDQGLSYVCATAPRFYAVSSVLSAMVAQLVNQPSQRLLKHIIRCYLRLADNQKYVKANAVQIFRDSRNALFCRAREALKQCLPDAFREGVFVAYLKDDQTTTKWLATLLELIQ